ncbi:rab-protein geranylgeranyltransferase [Cantharellus anzutake]|uniref:rab-protein geranylgeranyltransferase n=1 Tax=Cantharellus anzutake TaxID=1750568 RepID=UPI0019038D35|nr:rab-protein geranylgeranyltransferase [Cantharellus anzutake]KAF8337487.1 rab-protein geranylgeranyltransferase [Cantharellus anzutake]
MHGVRRQPRPPEGVRAERKEKELEKIKSYTALTKAILDRRNAKDYSNEALESTTRLLQLNPEFYTIWNYRREIFLRGLFPNSAPKDVNRFLQDDLAFTLSALKEHPKVYWIWNHRRWCLEQIPPDYSEDEGTEPLHWQRQTWNRELTVVEKMLDADARNFQAWNYRRYVLKSMPPPGPSTPARTPATELAYTQKKIESNFSNFSAWHQRSKVLSSPRINHTLMLTSMVEFDFVVQAMYTDPNDQSAWLYHRWLISLTTDLSVIEREIKIIEELLQEEPESKWCLESLIQYNTLVARLAAESGDGRFARQSEIGAMLTKLKSIDPMRKARYIDMLHALDDIPSEEH